MDNGNGTWSWSFDTSDGPDESQTVTITATDSDGAATSTTFALVVDNVAPTVAADNATVTVSEGATAGNTGTLSDPGADTVTLTASVGTVLDNGNGTWSWSFDTSDGPDESQTVTITATDSDGAATSTTFELVVDNVAPTVAADNATVTVSEGATAGNTGTLSDPGADTVTLTASAGTVLDNGNGTWSWSFDTSDGPDESQTVTITATDSDGAATSTTFDLIVDNVAPTVAADNATVTVSEGATAGNTGTLSDPGADTVTLTASVGTVLDNGNGTWSWSFDTSDGPDESQTVTITATDSDGAATSTTFALVVDNVAPTVAADNATVTVSEGATAGNTGTLSDPGADTVTLTASVGTVLDNGNGTWSWSFDTSDGPDESQTVTITATDSDGAATSTTFALVVDNVAPTVAADNATVTVSEGATAGNTGTLSDPGADTVTLTASVGTVLDNGNGTWSWSFDTSDGPDESQTVTITATDSDGAATSTTFALVVDNVAPTVAADNATVTVSEGATAGNTGTLSDPGADTVTLTASVGTVLDNGNGTWSWSFDTSDGPDESQTVTITATDSDGAATSTTFALVVDNVAPTVAADNATVTISEGATAGNTGTLSDPGADTVTLTASVGTVLDNGNGTWSWSFDTSDGPDESQTVTITATDSDGAATSTTFDLIVDNVAPTVAADNATVTVSEGATAGNTGTLSDPGADTVTLTASVGTVLDNGNGTWSWSFDTSDGPDESQTVTITATDSDGAATSTTFALVVDNVAPEIVSLVSSATFQTKATLDGDLVVTNMGQVTAEYHNSYGYYVTDENGEPTTGVVIWSDTKQNIGDSFVLADIDPDVVGFFIIPDGQTLNPGLTNGSTVAFHEDLNDDWYAESTSGDVLQGQGANAFFSHRQLNADNKNHVKDNSVIGDQNWEDLFGGGDRDFDDVNIGVSYSGMVTIQGDYQDVSVLDNHTVTVDWGDGTQAVLEEDDLAIDQVNDSFAITHHYTTGGIFDVRVSVTDDDGDLVMQDIEAVVSGVRLSPDGDLQIVGSDLKDIVVVRAVSAGSQLKVSYRLGTLSGDETEHRYFDSEQVGHVFIVLCESNDWGMISTNVDIPTEIQGGGGNDRLIGGGGPDRIWGGDGHDVIVGRDGDDYLSGGDGDDTLTGGNGNDILLGGNGRDRLWGGRGLDLLIGGYDADDLSGNRGDDVLIGAHVALGYPMLEEVMNIWSSNNNYEDRVAALTDESGFLEPNVKVFNDNHKDKLSGNVGRDVFFAQLIGSGKDLVKDAQDDELLIELD